MTQKPKSDFESGGTMLAANAACTPSPNPPPLPQPPAGFDSQLAYLLGLCCNSANDQYTTHVTTTPPIPNDPKLFDPKNWGIKSVNPKPWNPDFSQIISLGYKPTHCTNLSVYETDVNGNSVEIPAGFIVRLDSTGTKTSSMVVVAFHGTQNNFELNKIDDYVVPAMFGGALLNKWDLGSVHGGFYAQYTTGSSSQGDLVVRADGSLAQQIYQYFHDNGDENLSVKVTGHSMGGALATLCALDIAYNFESKYKSISMYSLASPRVADALADEKDRGSAATFVSKYQQYVPDSYRIVNTLDGVPNLPTALTPPLGMPLNVCAHILGDSDALLHKLVNPSSLDQNVVSFTDPNTQNGSGSTMECQGPHSCLQFTYLS